MQSASVGHGLGLGFEGLCECIMPELIRRANMLCVDFSGRMCVVSVLGGPVVKRAGCSGSGGVVSAGAAVAS